MSPPDRSFAINNGTAREEERREKIATIIESREKKQSECRGTESEN
jgi:hypothetical protein